MHGPGTLAASACLPGLYLDTSISQLLSISKGEEMERFGPAGTVVQDSRAHDPHFVLNMSLQPLPTRRKLGLIISRV
jgi:hypothetical protein